MNTLKVWYVTGASQGPGLIFAKKIVGKWLSGGCHFAQDAYNRASGKLAAMMEELEMWKSSTLAADYQ